MTEASKGPGSDPAASSGGSPESVSGKATGWAGAVRRGLLELPRFQKRALLVFFDFASLTFIVWAAMTLRYGDYYVPADAKAAALMLLAPIITVSTFAWFGLYRLVTRFIGFRGAVRIAACVGLSVLIWSLIVFMSGQHGIPRTVIFTYGLAAALVATLSRQFAGLILKSAGIRIPKLPLDIDRKPVLIYGAGEMGVQLLQALRGVVDYEPVGFIDPEPSMWGQYLGGIKVYRPEKIGHIIERAGVKEVLLAVSEGKRRERRQLLTELESYPVAVKVLPAMEDIATGRVGITDVRPLEVEDLLGRDPVPPDLKLLSRSITGKSILVTGAGGSVGSELVRQILKQGPRTLVLLDISEPALYGIEIEISEEIARLAGKQSPAPKLVSVLGSVLDEPVVRRAITEHGVQTIYHAAAYKHVPIVEHNAVVGLQNNTFGCAAIARMSRDLGVERCVLISTDKAVRPTNVMGASKRLGELILQAHAAEKDVGTVFTMVRFGNVLDSSGSVVRRFRDQIASGGPVTVTHPEVIRYFMSIPEAAELVIQAGAMATGGEVFVLDMGEPVKIDDLARLMVQLAGLELRSSDAPDGEIDIVYTGLRPGEKLYEELLIGANTTGTEHARIMRSDEPFLPSDELSRELAQLKAAMKDFDTEAIHAVLMRTVEGYLPPELLPGSESPSRVWATTSRTLH